MIDESLNRLCQLVQPPDEPLYNAGEWQAVERELGLQLPGDYKRLIEVFGQGVFQGHQHLSGLLVTSFFGPTPPATQAEGASAYLGTLDELTYKVYPGSPGLLGFGAYADEDTIAWHTLGSPDEWPIVYHDVETGLHEFKGIGILDLVVAILEEKSPPHKDGIIMKGEMEGPHTFRPEP